MVEVVAALIWKNGKFLICRRPAHKARGLLWEFVGGKVEPGESKPQALVRECREELDITVSVEDEFICVRHDYEDLSINLTLFNASIASGNITLLEHCDYKWILPCEIDNYEFCGADYEILDVIKQRYC